MSLLDDIKAKADANGDGKINLDDLEALRTGDNGNIIDQLKEKALGSDGKLDMNDLTNFNFDGIKAGATDLVDKAKDSLGDIFDKK